MKSIWDCFCDNCGVVFMMDNQPKYYLKCPECHEPYIFACEVLLNEK